MNDSIKVECPCCNTALVIDKATGVVLSHKEPQKETQSLEDFMEAEKNKISILEEKFNESREKEKNKFDALNAKFKHAQDNEADLDDPPPSVMWD